MAKKHKVTLEALKKDLKEKNLLKATLQRRVPVLIKNNNTVELDDLYKQIAKMTVEIFNLERQRTAHPDNGKEKEKG